jgi:hypothetical protein
MARLETGRYGAWHGGVSRQLGGACGLGKAQGCLGKARRQGPDAEAVGATRRGHALARTF